MHLSLSFTILILLFTYSFFKRSHCTPPFQKRNIIIFFTKPNVDINESPIDDSGLKFLKFPVSGTIQSSDDIPPEFNNIFKINLNSPDCNAIFNTYLLDLINWAIEDNRMVTATVSNEETDFNQIILKNMRCSLDGSYKNYRYTFHSPQNMKKQRKATWANSEPLDPYRNDAINLNEFNNLPIATIDPSFRDPPPLRYENHGDFMRDITAYNIIDKDEYGFKRVQLKLQGDKKANDKIDKNKYTATASTKKKEKYKVSKATTTSTTIKANENKTTYNFSALSSFFYKLQDVFMNSLLNPYEKRDINSEENEIDSSVLGKVHENTMLKLIVTTLKSLKMQSRNQGSKIHGFLLIVIGGHLSEVSDPFSELVQSVKYVVEHTNKQDTLILVTCYCPINVPESKGYKRQIPFFAEGMGSNEFENSVYMWDMLDKMKNSVKKTWKKGKSKVNQMFNSKKTGNKTNKQLTDQSMQLTTTSTTSGSSVEYRIAEEI